MGGGKRGKRKSYVVTMAGELKGQKSLVDFLGVEKVESNKESLGQYIKRHQKLIGKIGG